MCTHPTEKAGHHEQSELSEKLLQQAQAGAWGKSDTKDVTQTNWQHLVTILLGACVESSGSLRQVGTTCVPDWPVKPFERPEAGNGSRCQTSLHYNNQLRGRDRETKQRDSSMLCGPSPSVQANKNQIEGWESSAAVLQACDAWWSSIRLELSRAGK